MSIVRASAGTPRKTGAATIQSREIRSAAILRYTHFGVMWAKVSGHLIPVHLFNRSSGFGFSLLLADFPAELLVVIRELRVVGIKMSPPQPK
jgi:hypothetical protein